MNQKHPIDWLTKAQSLWGTQLRLTSSQISINEVERKASHLESKISQSQAQEWESTETTQSWQDSQRLDIRIIRHKVYNNYAQCLMCLEKENVTREIVTTKTKTTTIILRKEHHSTSRNSMYSSWNKTKQKTIGWRRKGRQTWVYYRVICRNIFIHLYMSFSLILVLSLEVSIPVLTLLFRLWELPLRSSMRLSYQIQVGSASLPYSEVHGWVAAAFSDYHLESELRMSLSEQWVTGLKHSCGKLPFFCLSERRIFTLDNLTGLFPLRILNRLMYDPWDRELWLTADSL